MSLVVLSVIILGNGWSRHYLIQTKDFDTTKYANMINPISHGILELNKPHKGGGDWILVLQKYISSEHILYLKLSLFTDIKENLSSSFSMCRKIKQKTSTNSKHSLAMECVGVLSSQLTASL